MHHERSIKTKTTGCRVNRLPRWKQDFVALMFDNIVLYQTFSKGCWVGWEASLKKGQFSYIYNIVQELYRGNIVEGGRVSLIFGLKLIP